MSKLVVHQLLQPLMGQANLHLLCQEDELDDLLGDLALHRLDVVLADQSAPTNPNLRVYSHPLGKSELAWYAPEALVATAEQRLPRDRCRVFRYCCRQATLRCAYGWTVGSSAKAFRRMLSGEFEDSALLVTFGAAGMGVLPAPTLSNRDLMRRRLLRIGACSGVMEEHFLICTERKVVHPLIQRLFDAHG